MKNYRYLILLLFAGITLACTPSMKGPVPQTVIFETDMGNDIDDAMALDLLFKNMDQGKINLLGIGVHKNNPYSQEYIDIMRCWYGYEEIPIGVNTACITDKNAVDYCTKTCQMKDASGQPLFARSKQPNYEEAVSMYRRLLAQQDDHSVVIITVGFSTTISQLLESQPDAYSSLSGRELVAQKVKYFSIMAGEFIQEDFAEFNVINDIKAAKNFFETSPVPMIYTPWTIGDQVHYPGQSIAEDFNWNTPHPMVEAYKHYLEMPYDRPTWDVIAAYYACNPEAASVTISQPGNIHVTEKGVTEFTPDANGKSRYLTSTPEQQKMILEDFIQTLTTKPAKMK